MDMRIDYEPLLELLDKKDFYGLRQKLIEFNEVDIAEFLLELPNEKATRVFRTLPKEIAADVFVELDSDYQQSIIEIITDKELAYIIEDLYVDDAVDVLDELPAILVKKVLKTATPGTRALINQFFNYPEFSAGSIMTAEFTDLRKTMTITEAIDHIRETGENRETIYTCYVIDKNRILEGVVSVKDLLLQKGNVAVEEIMDDDIIKVHTTDDQEHVAKLFRKYNLLSLPVVDNENRLVGIVTVDDAVEVLEQEATEDFEKMAAISPSDDEPYLKTSVFELVKRRIVWLLLLMISGMLTGSILGKYTEAFASIPLLVTFIPMLTNTGGNAGSQSSTLVIRGMALGDIKIQDVFKVLCKEIAIGFIVGVILSVVNFGRLVILYPDNVMISLTVAIALFFTVVMAKCMGCLLPIIAKFFKADPALMASPLITTIVDAFSLIVYFNVAGMLLKV